MEINPDTLKKYLVIEAIEENSQMMNTEIQKNSEVRQTEFTLEKEDSIANAKKAETILDESIKKPFQ